MKILKKLLLLTFFSFAFASPNVWAGEDGGEGLDLKNYREPMENIITGGQPSEHDLEVLASRGVDLIISFRAPGEFDDFDEAAAVESLGMKYLNIPIPKMKNDLTEANAKLLHDALEAEDGLAYLHCTIGMRAAAMLALDQYYFHGASEEEAVALGVKAHMDHVGEDIEAAIEKDPKE